MAAGASAPTATDYLLTFFKEHQMGAHTTPTKEAGANWAIPDPGDAGAIDVRQSGVVNFTSGAAGETRTLARPRFVGQEILLGLDTDGGGDVVVTVTGTLNQTGNNTITFADAGESLLLKAATLAGDLVWRAQSPNPVAEGPALSTVA
jgi:hypothetical protein